RFGTASRGPTTACSRLPTTSAPPMARPTWPSLVRAALFGSSRRPGCRRFSSRIRTRPRITRRRTPGTSRLRVLRSSCPRPGWSEVVVSTAYRDQVEGRPRADFLAELVSLQRSIVVAGAHGKTTTAAMIAFCLDRLGDDPAFLIGGEIPQLGGNARAGGGWLI